MTSASSANTLGKYALLAELGHGGMADVYLAVQSGPGGFSKLLVLKRLRANLADDPEFITMLIDEGRLAARLNHPNIVQTTEVGDVDGVYFIAMEYLDGQPLHRLMHRAAREGKPMSLAMQLHILIEVLAGVHSAHELRDYDGTSFGVVHRDISPQNVFVTYEGQVKVVDFGIAKAMGRSTETRAGIVKGKVAYMPREQALGLEIDRRADVFAIGAMLFEAIAGRRLWKGVSDLQIMERLVSGDLPSLRAVKPDVDEELERICNKAIAADREDRYATARDLQVDLEAYVDAANEASSSRKLAAFASELYADKRKQTRAVIEDQMAALRSGKQAPEGVALPQSPSSMTLDTIPGSSHGVTSSLKPTVLPETPTVPPESTRRRARPRGWLGRNSERLVFALAAVGVLVVGLLWRSRLPVPAALPAPAPAAAPTVALTTTLVLKATPAEARMFFDGQPLDGNPYVGRVPRDDAPHTLRVEAPGHVTKNVDIILSEKVRVDVSLETAAAVAPARP